MADDDFFEAVNQTSRNWCGSEMSSDDIVRDFRLHGFARRAEILDEMDNHLKVADTSNWNKTARLISLRREMGDFHHAARKVGR